MVLLLMALPMKLIELVQWILVPLCFVLAWGLVGLGAWTLVMAARDSVAQATEMHKIPCAECRYFTNDHRLKCPIHPRIALSEAAIDCADFEQADLV